MQLYFAPLEGITGYLYRNNYEKHYGGISRYYSPFLVTKQGGIMKKKEWKDILPENNKKICLIPQLLTNNAKDFCSAALQIKEMGYGEVNLNLGCPSGTVVSKGRGSGFLDRTIALNRFLEEIYSECEDKIKISIKTRIGMYEAEEFYELLKIYNQYPICELIIHPRTRMEYYKGTIHMDIFEYAYNNSKNKICYNGDILSLQKIHELQKNFPNMYSVMIGRGLISKPGFAGIVRNQESNDIEIIDIRRKQQEKEQLKEFMYSMLKGYQEVLSGDIHVLHKMKELWLYMAPQFSNYEKYLKKIKKTNKLSEYQITIANLFENEELNDG